MATITKGELVSQAYEELIISGVTSQPTPREVKKGLATLENLVMMWTLSKPVVDIGYIPVVEGEVIDANDESGIAPQNVMAVMSNLACKLAASYGRQLPRSLLAEAKEGFEGLLPVTPPEMRQNPYQPAGQGFEHNAYSPAYMETNDPDL